MVNIRIRKGVIIVYLSFSSIWYLLQRLTKLWKSSGVHKWENNKMGLREISYENVKWIEMVLDRIKLQAFLNTVVWFP